jgi:hypothetical protein
MLRTCAMKRSTLRLCSVIVVFPSLICPAFAERGVPPAALNTLSVAVLPQEQYSPSMIQEMTREVSRIMRESGLKIDWHLGGGQKVFDEPLAVVKLSGTCNMDVPARTSGKTGPLGWTHSADGKLLPFSELACDNIRHAISLEMRNEDWTKANETLGRAAGRVLAHELFHIVAATTEHTGAGISKPALTPAELLSDRLDFDPAGIELIQDRLHGTR